MARVRYIVPEPTATPEAFLLPDAHLKLREIRKEAGPVFESASGQGAKEWFICLVTQIGLKRCWDLSCNNTTQKTPVEVVPLNCGDRKLSSSALNYTLRCVKEQCAVPAARAEDAQHKVLFKKEPEGFKGRPGRRNPNVTRHFSALARRLGMYKCWNVMCRTENPAKLVVDHISGDRTDNRTCNLRLLCTGCDPMTPTWCRGGGASKKKRKIGAGAAKQNDPRTEARKKFHREEQTLKQEKTEKIIRSGLFFKLAGVGKRLMVRASSPSNCNL